MTPEISTRLAAEFAGVARDAGIVTKITSDQLPTDTSYETDDGWKLDAPRQCEHYLCLSARGGGDGQV